MVGIAADIAAGMSFLHGRNILHGDLTCSAPPRRLLLSERMKLQDLGPET